MGALGHQVLLTAGGTVMGGAVLLVLGTVLAPALALGALFLPAFAVGSASAALAAGALAPRRVPVRAALLVLALAGGLTALTLSALTGRLIAASLG